MPPLPGLRTDDLALTGVKKQVSKQSPLCSRELSPKSYGCLAPEGRHLECRGRKPTGPAATRALGGERTVLQHNLSHRAALGSMPSKAHQLRLAARESHTRFGGCLGYLTPVVSFEANSLIAAIADSSEPCFAMNLEIPPSIDSGSD